MSGDFSLDSLWLPAICVSVLCGIVGAGVGLQLSITERPSETLQLVTTIATSVALGGIGLIVILFFAALAKQGLR